MKGAFLLSYLNNIARIEGLLLSYSIKQHYQHRVTSILFLSPAGCWIMLLHCGTERLRYCRLSFASGAFVGGHVTCQTSGVAKSTMTYFTLRTISTLSGLLLLC